MSYSIKNRLETYTHRGKRIPYYMCESIVDYIENRRIERGDFLWNLVTNNLCGVYRTADSNNINLIEVYVAFFYNEVPANCWGSEEKVINWLTWKE